MRRLTMMSDWIDDMPNRYLCDVLEELRKCWKTRNFAPLSGLCEEIQTIANRMEASLGDKRDVERLLRQRPEIKDEIKELRWKKEDLEEEVRALEHKKKELQRFLDKNKKE